MGEPQRRGNPEDGLRAGVLPTRGAASSADVGVTNKNGYDALMSYETTTKGIRVSVQPSFSLSHSEPDEGRFVFTYLVELENQGDETATLLFRHWHIHDAMGEDSEVDGEARELPRI